MIKLNPYLTFPGTANDAIELYKKVFKVDPVSVQKFKDMPPAASAQGSGPLRQSSSEVSGPQHEGVKMSSAGGERIIHAGFQIGNDMLMISDAPESQDHTVIMGTQTHVSLHPDSREEADRMFQLLSEGGEVVMPMAMQFWGDYFGMCKDKFGIHWMVNYHQENK